MTGIILEGPWEGRRPVSAREIELQRIEREFRNMGRRDQDIFEHLAKKMAGYLKDVEKFGQKTGAIGRIIGGDSDGTARHRHRFCWDGSERDFKQQPLAKAPGQWLAVLSRCAEELKQPVQELLLDAFAGSRLRPSLVSTEYARTTWLQSFLELMMAMEERLCGQPHVQGLLSYIAAEHLEKNDDGNLVEADEPILPWFQADVPEWEELLYQLPYTQVCTNILGEYYYHPEDNMKEGVREAWTKILERCEATPISETHRISLFMKVRRGLAIVPGNESERPRLALFKWPNVSLIAYESGINYDNRSVHFQLPRDVHSLAGEILFPRYYDFPPHMVERVLFAPVGTEAFSGIACESFPEYRGSVGGADESCWDPLYSDEGQNIEWSSSSPKATVAAMIERNLLFADVAGVPEQRVDRLLQADLNWLGEAVNQYRSKIVQITEPARNNLLSEWRHSDEI